MRTIMDKVHRSFNVSVAEWTTTTIRPRSLSPLLPSARTRREVRELLDRVADAVAVYPRAEILSHDITEV